MLDALSDSTHHSWLRLMRPLSRLFGFGEEHPHYRGVSKTLHIHIREAWGLGSLLPCETSCFNLVASLFFLNLLLCRRKVGMLISLESRTTTLLRHTTS